MSWINEHKYRWRAAFLVMLVVAISGPWFFDRSYAPSPYTCSATWLRLDDKFCGKPQSVTWFLSLSIGELTYIVTGLVTGTLSLADATRQSLFLLFLFLLLLPFLSTAILILRGSHRRWYMLHRVGLGLAAGIGGFIAVLDFSSAHWWVLWGLWLYISLNISTLALEVLTGKRWQM